MTNTIYFCVKNEKGEYVPVITYIKELEEKLKWLQGKKK